MEKILVTQNNLGGADLTVQSFFMAKNVDIAKNYFTGSIPLAEYNLC